MTARTSPAAPRPDVLCPVCRKSYRGVPSADRKGWCVREHTRKEVRPASADFEPVFAKVRCSGSGQPAQLDTRGVR